MGSFGLVTGPAWTLSVRTEAIDVEPEQAACHAWLADGVVDGCGVTLFVGPNDQVPVAATDSVLDRAVRLQHASWEGAGPEVADRGIPVYVEDLWSELGRWPWTTPSARELPMRGLAVVPLLAKDSVVGIFTAYWREPHHVTAEDRVDIERFCDALAVLAHERLERVGRRDCVFATPMAPAIGMVMGRLGVSESDALALLRARAFVMDVAVPDYAHQLVAGELAVEALA